jgi:hypothetical protein
MATFDEKMAARRAGTVEVNVGPAPKLAGSDPGGIEAKLARHRAEGKTEAERAAEAKAAEAKLAPKAEGKPRHPADDHKK